MKRYISTAVLCFLVVAMALLISSATPTEAPQQEWEVARVYQSPMVVPELKTQAPEPESTMDQVKPEIESSTTLSANKETSGQISATVTHYCACSKCNGKWSYSKDGANFTETASGIVLYDGIGGNYCAATFGSLGDILTINGIEYEIVDRMGGNSGKRIDIFVADGHDRCNELGRYTADVTLKGYGCQPLRLQTHFVNIERGTSAGAKAN